MKNASFLFLLFALFLAPSCVVTDDDPVTPTPEPDPEPSSLRTGLLFHTPFSGNADDVAVNALSGTVTGATITADRFGNANEAYSFDGVNDYINYGNAPDLGLGGSVPYTMTAWVKPNAQAGDARLNVITKFNGSVLAGWYLGVTPERSVQAYRNVAPWSLVGGTTVDQDEYVHIASSYDGANITVYVNGEVDGTRSFGSHPNDQQTDLLIGAIHTQNVVEQHFRGVIDDIRIYNRVLTQEELTWLAGN